MSEATCVNAQSPNTEKKAVTYSHSPVKTVAVPPCSQKPVLDGSVTSDLWSEAAQFDDFACYQTRAVPTARTTVRAMRYETDLYLGIVCEEPEAVVAHKEGDKMGQGIWDSDLVEIFFGGLHTEQWCLQLAVNAAGRRFCDNSRYDLWEIQTCCSEHQWSAEVRVPLSMLNLADGGCGFNLCRQRLHVHEFVTWGPVQRAFHEPENFGLLLFCDYQTAALQRLGKAVPADLTRQDYEELAWKCSRFACEVSHGPYLTNPTENSLTVNWRTAGKCAAWVEIREKGQDTWQRFAAEYANGVVRLNHDIHHVHLAGLKPGTQYDYRLALRTLLDREDFLSDGGSFTTLSAQSPTCRFALFSDIHGESTMIRKLWTSAQDKDLDFCVNLGDMLSAVNGPNDFYGGYLDTETELFARHTPLAIVRGNHELRGFFSAGFFDLLNHPSGKTYYGFRQGPAFFIVLDGAEDFLAQKEFFEEERQWLENVVQTDEYQKAKFRIVLNHFPVCDDNEYTTQIMRKITAGLLDGTTQIPHPQLWLGGHWHSYFRIDAHRQNFMAALDGFHSKQLPDMPYTVVANDGPGEGGYPGSMIITEIDEQHIHITAWNPDGEKIDDVTIDA